MDEVGVDLLLGCSRANVGYLADYTYYVAQGLPYVLEDGRQWSITFVGVARDPKIPAASLTIGNAAAAGQQMARRARGYKP